MDFSRRASKYKQYRKGDIRLTNHIERILNIQLGSTIADIGAGTGNYTIQLMQKGYNLFAIEP